MHSKKIIFVGVEGLHELPSSIGQLSVLLNLDLNNCSKIQKSRTSISQLSAFQNLHLDDCLSL